MPIVGRLDQYASMLAREFDETTANNPSITGLGTYYASEFNENVVESIVTSGLVLALDAANTSSYPGSGTTWFDISGNGRNFTWISTPTFTSNGSASYFSTLGNRCTGPASNSFGIDNTSGYTIFLVSKQNALAQSSAFKFYGSVALNRGIFSHCTWDDNVIYFDQGGCCSSSQRTQIASGGANTWNIWAFRRLSNSSERSIIKNGTTLTTNTAGAANIDLNSTGVDLGSSDEYGGNSSTWNAQLNSFIVYNRGLSDGEITQNYNALAGRYGLATTGLNSLMSANVFPPYDPVYDDFGGTLFGAGQGRYMRQNTDKSVVVYNEIDEVTDFVDQLRGIVSFVSTPPATMNTLSSDGSKLVFSYGPYPSNPTVYISSSPYTSWTAYSGPGGGGKDQITYANGFYFICGAINNAQFHRSPDGINWTACNISGNGSSTTYSFVYNSARSEWITGGGSWVGTNCVRKSTDGLNFSLTYTYPSGTSGTTYLATSNLNDASAYMYRMETGNSTTTLSVARSQDATTWTESNWIALNGTSLLRFLVYFNGRYWACNSSNVLGTTTDGLTWTNYSNANLDFQMIAAGSFTYRSVTYSYISGNNVFALSVNGEIWTKYNHSFSTLYHFNIVGFEIYATNGTSIYKII